jgi:transcriptional regulator with XRE-family HTH domain
MIFEMTQEKYRSVTDPSKFRKLSSKEYRDAYLESQVRSWIAYQFQALRRKLALSQTEMAHRIGKPQSVISRLENADYGRVSVQTLLEVATCLDIALVVQFVSYPEFLDRTRDKSELAMQPENFNESWEEIGTATIPVSKALPFRSDMISTDNRNRSTERRSASDSPRRDNPHFNPPSRGQSAASSTLGA